MKSKGVREVKSKLFLQIEPAQARLGVLVFLMAGTVPLPLHKESRGGERPPREQLAAGSRSLAAS